ncbi:fused MFS/spermidine synthase [Legionella lytica]|uniref:Fused MFS/spermidine synthase n=1 Tax=Legionella lytica TaxID=96232 RepID=A0ABY4YAM6_9GAMM|nr:fused MFS/spermidine synthase [Legionella lytica]USQ14679.1 fused MFS/spermidine synthase [Legionella lytica]
MLHFLFPVCLFLSAVLLFSIQPMAAKALLPVYGGTPAVWTVCMLFFQAVLLVAYGYAALLSALKNTKTWRIIHSIVLVLSLSTIPLFLRPVAVPGAPEWSILYNLLTQLGLPLLVLGASAPLLQFAYSQTKAKGATDPYFLYSASNLGSLSSLILYPWVIERFIGLKGQFHWWGIGYLVYIGLLLLVFCTNRFYSLVSDSRDSTPWPWRQMAYWVFLSFVPCSLMLGVTLYITTDVAATPLFWVLPLALYLLTFVFAFSSKPLISLSWLAQNFVLFLVFTVLGFILGAGQIRAWQSILFNLASFFILAVLCHRQLFLKRPKPQLLTLFYFCLALGGVLAGIFNGILAPHWFNQVYEYPLAILLSLVALPISWFAEGNGEIKPVYHQQSMLQTIGIPAAVLAILLCHYFIPAIQWPGGFSNFQIGAIVALMIAAVWGRSKASLLSSLFILFGFIFSPYLQGDKILVQERNFYGVKKVVDKGADKNAVHALISQSTVHGLEAMNDAMPFGFSSYYGAIQSVVMDFQQEWPSMSVTIIGLGIGTMACQFRHTDEVKIIEIDEQVIKIAKDPHYFTYLRDCPPKIELIKNDGRLAVEQLMDGSQKLLMVDAFSSDAIPIHLITLEAFSLYRQKISEDGAILINLSNRHLDLLPVVTAAGRALDLMVFSKVDQGNAALGQFASQWALLTINQDLAAKLMNANDWHFVANNKQLLWTDDYSNIIPLLKW